MNFVEPIRDGNLEVQANVESRDEVGLLAQAFNDMTSKLRYALQLAIERSRRLETVANLGDSLNAIVDTEGLLNELVIRVKEQFNYYHTQIFLIDEERRALVLNTGYGESAHWVKADYKIPLDAPISLVARAASTRKVVSVDDVHERKDWLSNPLLPDSRCEMAVPIIAEGKVLGVLDVQSNRVAGLDEDDADLLRSLANHVAVAMINAQLFEQAIHAKEEAEEANRLKSRFLATMSHELRTPLSSVINFAQIIKRENWGL